MFYFSVAMKLKIENKKIITFGLDSRMARAWLVVDSGW